MRYFLLFIFIHFLPTIGLKSQSLSKEDLLLAEKINEILKQHHVDYEKLKDLVPERFGRMLIYELDPRAELLTQQDIAFIQSELGEHLLYPAAIDKTLTTLRDLLTKRINATLSLLGSIEQVDFFEIDSTSPGLRMDLHNYAKDASEHKVFWLQKLKYHTLLMFHEDSLKQNGDNKAINQFLTNKVIEECEANICYLENLKKIERLNQYLLNAYLNAYCLSFDPHTGYLSPQEEQQFENQLSSRIFGTGITYSTNGSKFFIADISAFSEASKFTEIERGDEIISIGSAGVMEHPTCMDPQELNELLYGERPDYVDIELRSASDYKLRAFHIAKGNFNNTSNHTYAFLLQENDFKLGYILFPKFYTPFSPGGRSSSEDLALTLLYLKDLSVDGIIVDLRGNGGGSVAEAADFLSFFIDYGPLFTITNNESHEGTLIKDTRKGKITDGKVIFLVNSFSASASEVVAAVMQEYPNSIIVGSPTFGKATGQLVIPVNQNSQDSQGSVSVTTLKIYEFTGDNYQGTGVTPDIIMPSFLTRSFIGEDKYSNPLHHGRMRKFRAITHRNEPIDSLNSRYRLRGSLEDISDLGKTIEQFLSNKIEINYDRFSNPFSLLSSLKMDTSMLSFEMLSLEKDEAFQELSDQLIKEKLKDPILQETFLIFKDWDELANNN